MIRTTEQGENKDGQVGTWPEQQHKIEKDGILAWRPYATSGAEIFINILLYKPKFERTCPSA